MLKTIFKAILYRPLFNLLVFFAWLVPGHSMGGAIILLTIVVKLILWVPQSKALRSPLQMRAHQADIKALQDRYKDDRTAQAQALMAFYKENGINPLSGCLPALIQLPVLLIMYQVFRVGLHDLRPDLLYSFTPHLNTLNATFFGIDLSRPDKWVLPIIAGVAQFFQARHYAALSSGSLAKDDPAAMMNKQMMYVFPVVTVLIGRSLPAGLALYWAASTLFAWAQQYYVLKTFKVKPSKSVSVTVREKK